MSCIFCQIANKKAPAEVVYEDKEIIAFKDIHPQAPIHLLVIPKKHILSVDHLKTEDKELMGELILTTQKIAQEMKLNGYKIQINVGRPAGQLIDHLHLHLLAWPSK